MGIFIPSLKFILTGSVYSKVVDEINYEDSLTLLQLFYVVPGIFRKILDRNMQKKRCTMTLFEVIIYQDRVL